jgi:ribA/ribD-fused uncharacterized protein
MIDSFTGEYAFLSNFYPAHVRYGGIYPTSEHAFQAMKTLSLKERLEIAKLPTPAQAKRAGKKLTLREDWEDIKLCVMEKILLVKFSDRELAEKLIATGGQMLVEGNNWGDRFWGVCNGEGDNNLGKLLMRVRATCRKKYPDLAAKYPLPEVDCTDLSWAGMDGTEDPEIIALHVCALIDYAKNMHQKSNFAE